MRPDPLSIITARVLAPLRHLVTPDATLAELRLDEIDRLSLAHDLYEAFGVSVPDAAVESWATVGDVIQSVREMADV